LRKRKNDTGKDCNTLKGQVEQHGAKKKTPKKQTMVTLVRSRRLGRGDIRAGSLRKKHGGIGLTIG